MQARPGMDQQQQPPSRATTIAVGALAAAVGLYFILASLGVVPPPGRRNPHDPLWIAFGAGLAFLLGGVAVLTRALASDTTQTQTGELPASAPRWLHLVQYAIGLAAVACLAAIATWIAFGAGTRSFDVSAPFFKTSGGAETVGRIVFGIGAVVTWLCLAALAVGGARRILRRKV
jgi:hypothetical protein